MKRISTLILLINVILVTATGCTLATLATHEHGEHEHEEEGEEGHGMEMHQPAHGGQVGMAMGAATGGADFHLEIVSDTPGQYGVYLSDAEREPVSPEGYEGALALINPDGSEIVSLPLVVMDDHLMAEGGPTDESQVDVRITLEGPDLADVLEMDFVVLYTE